MMDEPRDGYMLGLLHAAAIAEAMAHGMEMTLGGGDSVPVTVLKDLGQQLRGIAAEEAERG